MDSYTPTVKLRTIGNSYEYPPTTPCLYCLGSLRYACTTVELLLRLMMGWLFLIFPFPPWLPHVRINHLFVSAILCFTVILLKPSFWGLLSRFPLGRLFFLIVCFHLCFIFFIHFPERNCDVVYSIVVLPNLRIYGFSVFCTRLRTRDRNFVLESVCSNGCQAISRPYPQILWEITTKAKLHRTARFRQH